MKALIKRLKTTPTDIIKEKFEICDEEVIDDFNCALKKKILLQGTVYLTTKHICFYSKFNDRTLIRGSTKVQIAYSNVTAVKLVTNGMLPNTIKITATEIVEGYEQEAEYSLTSFLNVNNCFKLMQKQIDEMKVQ